MKVSACCIIKNEEKNLPDYIEGVRNIADEIIITDTGSTDNSLKLLEDLKKKYNLNLTVYHFEWINDFAAAKNFTLEKATGDWIMFLDADEYYDKKDRKKIRPLLEKLLPDDKVKTIKSPLLNIDVNNNNLPLSQSSQTRIFRRENDLKFVGAIHEHLLYKGTRDILIYNTKLLIIHTGYSTKNIKQKAKRNNEILMANKNLATDTYPVYYSYIASAYLAEGDYETAEEYIKKALDIMSKEYNSFYIETYLEYKKIKEKLKLPKEEIEKFIDEALEKTERHPDLLAEKLLIIMEKEDLNLDEAEKLANEIIEKSKDEKLKYKYINRMDRTLPYVHYALGYIYKVKNKRKEAENEFLIALNFYKYRKDVLNDLLDFCEGNEKKSLKILTEYYDEKSKTDMEFLSRIFADRPRDNLYKRYCKNNKNSVDYKLAAGKITDAIKLAAKEVEKAKTENLPPNEFKKNLKDKLHLLSITFLFLDKNLLPTLERELNLLPPSVIAVILKFHGENIPKIDGDTASYNAILNKAKSYLPKNLRDKFLNLKFD